MGQRNKERSHFSGLEIMQREESVRKSAQKTYKNRAACVCIKKAKRKEKKNQLRCSSSLFILCLCQALWIGAQGRGIRRAEQREFKQQEKQSKEKRTEKSGAWRRASTQINPFPLTSLCQLNWSGAAVVCTEERTLIRCLFQFMSKKGLRSG